MPSQHGVCTAYGHRPLRDLDRQVDVCGRPRRMVGLGGAMFYRGVKQRVVETFLQQVAGQDKRNSIRQAVGQRFGLPGLGLQAQAGAKTSVSAGCTARLDIRSGEGRSLPLLWASPNSGLLHLTLHSGQGRCASRPRHRHRCLATEHSRFISVEGDLFANICLVVKYYPSISKTIGWAVKRPGRPCSHRQLGGRLGTYMPRRAAMT